MSIEGRNQNTEGYLENREKPLKGKVALITGSSRDIGAGIAIALAKEGVQIIGNYREKAKRVEGVMEAIAQIDARADFVQADITDPQGRQELQTTLKESFGGKLDILILSASGPTRDINVIAANAMVNDFLPYMNTGGKIVLMQSVPGHFDPQLRGLGKMPDIYDPVAATKYEGEQSLRARIPEFKEHGVSFIIICPPIVLETSNVKFFDRDSMRKHGVTATDKHAEISDMLGIPKAVTINDVGQKVAELLKRKDLPLVYFEFFGKVEDANFMLSSWYDENASYIDTIERSEKDGKKQGIGRMIASKQRTEGRIDPPCVDEISIQSSNSAVGKLTVRDEHTIGHFKKGSELPWVFPGHKQIRAAVEVVQELIKMQGKPNAQAVLRGFDGVEFNKIITPGKTIEIDAQVLSRRGNLITQNVQIKMDGWETTRISNMVVEIVDEEDNDNRVLLEDQLIEGVAQTAGLTSAAFGNGKVMPLFQSIGHTIFYHRVNVGKGVEINVEVAPEGKRGFEANAIIKSSDIEVGKINNLRARVVPLDVVKRRLLRQ